MADLKVGFEHILARHKGEPPVPTAVAYPCSEDALVGAVDAAKAGLIAPVLVGPEERIRQIAAKAKLDLSPYELVPAPDAEESASVAAGLAGSGKARALMKGSLHTDQYMHAVLQRENRLRTTRLLSHCMLIAAPAYRRPIIISDAAVNIAPDLDQKRDIVQNAIILARAIGVCASPISPRSCRSCPSRTKIAPGFIGRAQNADAARFLKRAPSAKPLVIFSIHRLEAPTIQKITP